MSHTPQERQAPADADTIWLGLSSPEHEIDRLPLDRLSDLNRADMERFRSTWMALSPGRRRAVARQLVFLAEERIDLCFNDIFRWLLNDEDPIIRAQALDGLWEEEDVRLIQPATRLLNSDPAAEVRAAAALCLGRFLLLAELDQIDPSFGPAVEATLVKAFSGSEPSPIVKRRLLESLAFSSGHQVQHFILEAYKYGDDDMQQSALFAMGRNADLRWRPFVLAELVSTDNAKRFEAARASGELELADAVPDLLDILDEDEVELRDAAVWALGRIGGSQARRALQACADSDDESLRSAAQEALEELDFLAGEEELPTFGFDLNGSNY